MALNYRIYPNVLVRDLEKKKLLLGYKKNGFDKDKWGFFGNKPVEDNETDEESAIRQTKEETGLDVSDLKKVGYLEIQVGNDVMAGNLYVAYSFHGQIRETDETRPEWFDEISLPTTHRWLDDQYWLEKILANQFVKAHFVYSKNLDTLIRHKVEVFDSRNKLEGSLRKDKSAEEIIAKFPHGYCG